MIHEIITQQYKNRQRRLLVPFGDDFKFKRAALQFSQMDQLMREINDHPEKYHARLRYSVVEDYFDDVFSEAAQSQLSSSSLSLTKPPLVYPIYRGDFLPYADNIDSYWTGYFSSRSHLKSMAWQVLVFSDFRILLISDRLKYI